MRLLPLGSVVKLNQHKVCIIGYGSVDKEAGSVSGYFTVLYPLGFTSSDKVFFVPTDADMEVVAEGYQTAPSAKVLDLLAKAFEAVEKVPYEELLKVNEAFKKVASKKEANEE